MNYKIIADEELFREFINWLPECLPNEQFYICLFARKKYAPESGLTDDKSQLKRFTSTKERLFDKIRQLECSIGSYKTSKGEEVPEESLALYITPNPRDFIKASKEVAKELINRICEGSNTTNPKSLSLDKIQTSCSDKIWYDFDIDYKGESHDFIPFLKEQVKNAVGNTEFKIVEGRGGFHVLINLKSIDERFKNKWFNGIRNNEYLKSYIDMTGDLLLPVPGCCQGDFIPKFV